MGALAHLGIGRDPGGKAVAAFWGNVRAASHCERCFASAASVALFPILGIAFVSWHN